MMLLGTAVVTGGMLVWPLFGRIFAGDVALVGAFDAVQLINRRDAVVLDIRDKAEFAAGHIPNARNIPFAELASRAHELEKIKSRPIVVHCQTGTRVAAACNMLKKNGFEASGLRGGINAWLQAGMPVVK